MLSHDTRPVIGRLTGVAPVAAAHAGRDQGPLTTLAHELRGPLAAALYALASMPDPGSAAARQARTVAERQTRRATRIIDDVFDVCAGCHGKLVLRREVVGVSTVVERAVETTDHLLAGRGHQLEVSLPATPAYVFADPSRLEQVLTNLLANAAKFTAPGGHIRLNAEVDAEHVTFRVRDNGRGIPAHLLPRVFDLFAQGPENEEHRAGLGLGLALVRSLVELHGGSVTAASAGVGCGAEFVVRLPAHRAAG